MCLKILSVEIPGNIIIETENYHTLFDIIYSYSSDEIARLLNDVKKKYKKGKGEKLSESEKDEINLLNNLSNAFTNMKETPIVQLIKE